MTAFRITLKSAGRPLLMHNGRLADPLDPATKALKSATKKPASTRTDDDLLEIAHLEWIGGMYFDPEVGPYIPGENIERLLLDAARMTKQGKNIERGVYVDTLVNRLAYKGPRDLDGLWADANFRLTCSAKNPGQKARIMRCRPRFPGPWEVSTEGGFDPAILDFDVLAEIADTAGRMIGLGDWRPRFGRFTAELEKG